MKPRKRRTVLWLFQEDYEYLSSVAQNDSDSKNVSMRRLVKALRAADVSSFIEIQVKKSSQAEPMKRARSAAGL